MFEFDAGKTQEINLGGPNPFAALYELVGRNESIRIFDQEVESWESDKAGRVRILAIVPKKPQPLENIPFVVAWCNPEDVKKYRRVIANKIVAGRMELFLRATEDSNPDASFLRNGGYITEKLYSLNNLVERALFNVGQIPDWVAPHQFENPELRLRISNQHWGDPEVDGDYGELSF